MELSEWLKGIGVLLSVIDVASNRVETLQPAAETFRWDSKYLSIEHRHGCTDCGMAPKTHTNTEVKLQMLKASARLLSGELAR